MHFVTIAIASTAVAPNSPRAPCLNILQQLPMSPSLCGMVVWLSTEITIGPCFSAPLARYVKLRVAHAAGMHFNVSPPPRVSDPDMHHGTCVTHVPWCMRGSLYSGFVLSWWRGKRSRHSRRMHNLPAILRIWQEAHACPTSYWDPGYVRWWRHIIMCVNRAGIGPMLAGSARFQPGSDTWYHDCDLQQSGNLNPRYLNNEINTTDWYLFTQIIISHGIMRHVINCPCLNFNGGRV